jgi:hypothetical protein
MSANGPGTSIGNGPMLQMQNRISPLSKPWLSEYDADLGNAGASISRIFSGLLGDAAAGTVPGVR